MTKCQAVCLIDDLCVDKEFDALNIAIQDALNVGVTPGTIKKVLREGFVPLKYLWLETQEKLS